jgi:hypothetical protein
LPDRVDARSVGKWCLVSGRSIVSPKQDMKICLAFRRRGDQDHVVSSNYDSPEFLR